MCAAGPAAGQSAPLGAERHHRQGLPQQRVGLGLPARTSRWTVSTLLPTAKSCSELATHSYINSFFADKTVAVSTARAGNVIGGGDFANDRIIPDCVRAMAAGRKIGVRNPYSTRPYQHVLEPLAAYLLIAQRQYEDSRFAGYYNVGPDDCDCVTTGTLVDLFCRAWGGDAAWENQAEANAPHEANFLKLDCSKLKRPSAGRRAGTWPSAWKDRRLQQDLACQRRCPGGDGKGN